MSLTIEVPDDVLSALPIPAGEREGRLRLNLLVEQFGGVIIPMVVRNKLAKLPHEVGRSIIQAAIDEGWMTVDDFPPSPLGIYLRGNLDPGEAAAIDLACGKKADWLLIAT
jgi:predicted nucleic acid-binding protein